MKNTYFIFSREFSGYFKTPVAYIFLIIYLLLIGFFTFYFGDFFTREQADLQPFFQFHPWMYIFLIPAISMRLWSEERKSGTIELLLTLPITMWQAVLGKFLAAWAFTTIATILTFPIWITVNYLGNPDNGVILTAYIGSILMAGSFIAIGSCISAITKNQVIAFVVSLSVSLLLVLAGFPMVQNLFIGWMPSFIVDAISYTGFLTHYQSISKGVIDLRDPLFFISTIAVWLFANTIVIDSRKAV